jgi:hypothetical protein
VSFQVTEAFVQKYSNNMMLRAQQRGSRLRSAVTVETGVGKSYSFDYVGAVTAAQIVDRGGDSPQIDTPHNRRWVTLSGYETGDLIDSIDKVAMLADPESKYVETHGAAMGRAMDDVVIAAALGTSVTGETGTSTVSFPSGNQVAVNSWKYGSGTGNAGLTISKLIEARNILVQAEGLQPGEEITLVCAQKQISNLLSTTEATSEDFASVKALVKGDIDTFMGFNFIRSERLATDGSGYRRVLAFAKSGIGLAIGKDITAQIDRRPDKRFSWYAYFQMFIGATRLEEEKVVEIKCLET